MKKLSLIFAVIFFAISFSASAEWTTESLFCGLKIGMAEKNCRATLDNICKKYVTADSLCGDTVVEGENGTLTAIIYTTSALGDLELNKVYRCLQVSCFMKSGKLTYYTATISYAGKDDVLANISEDYNFLQNAKGFDVYDAGNNEIIGIKEAADFYEEGDGIGNITILVSPKQ